jgi:hypothetical protein
VNALYERLSREFEAQVAQLCPKAAYASIERIALQLANGSFPRLDITETKSSLPPEGRRKGNFRAELEHGYDLYGRGMLVEALDLASRVATAAETVGDVVSLIDAGHLKGRVLFDKKLYAEATECFATEMDYAQRMSIIPAFVRAVHEASRVRLVQYDLLRAEFGFRLAWQYYSIYLLRAGMAKLRDVPGSDLQNARVAMNCLEALSREYIVVADGTTEGDALIKRLDSPHFSVDASGDAFLEARGLAIECLASMPEHVGPLTRLVSRAMALHRDYPRISIYVLEEAEHIAEFSGADLPHALREVLSGSVRHASLRTDPFYKPRAAIKLQARDNARFTSPDKPAENPSVLYRYLKDSDVEGRYVYRGQTTWYPGPLLPSAFRPILTQAHGCEAVRLESIHDRSLRNCGDIFYGEYNRCFALYGNVTGHLQVSAAEAAFAHSVYKRLLRDIEITTAQEGNRYIPWAEAVRRVLSSEELSVFEQNKSVWMLRINNFHRRLYRSNLLVEPFGYTLGTTFAQQYGLASEGLDASKDINVAFFFASRDSKDFETTVEDGVGVIYRFPFPPNDVATQPLERYDYYSLPSIVDVEDVIYRFETKGLSEDESRECLDAYVGACLVDHLRNLNLLVLPEGFYATTRVARQHAVIIFPDEIREDHLEREPGPGGIRLPKYRYIEDLAARQGVQAFYFRHTGTAPEDSMRLTREYLWPREDVLLETVVRLVLAAYRLGERRPKRPELIDVGFDNEAFALEAATRLWSKRPILFDEQEKLALQNYVILL